MVQWPSTQPSSTTCFCSTTLRCLSLCSRSISFRSILGRSSSWYGTRAMIRSLGGSAIESFSIVRRRQISHKSSLPDFGRYCSMGRCLLFRFSCFGCRGRFHRFSLLSAFVPMTDFLQWSTFTTQHFLLTYRFQQPFEQTWTCTVQSSVPLDRFLCSCHMPSGATIPCCRFRRSASVWSLLRSSDLSSALERWRNCTGSQRRNCLHTKGAIALMIWF